MSYAIGIDIGGTCTDCAVVSDRTGQVSLAKTLSTPPDFSAGIVDVLGLIAEDLEISLQALLSDTALFLHSTSVAENAIVDGTLASAGLITTSGFEETLWATRGGYGRWSGLTELEKRDPLQTQKPPVLIPRELIRGLPRSGTKGDQRLEASDEDIDRTIKELLQQGAESIAVCLLWSFLSPEGELRIRQAIERHSPDTFATLSHEIAPTLGEYERTSTVALNARLGPVVARYLDNLLGRLRANGFRGSLLVMQAHGGLLPLSEAARRPVGMIESGPVSGVLGSRDVGRQLGINNLIAADMGGTTFKLGVVREGRIEYERESMVMRYHYSFPKLDVESLGLAGGSIIAVDRDTGVPSIGPRSAGSSPGPACYGLGGTHATVTDVDAILGYMNPEFFLGGKKSLKTSAARDAFQEHVANPLGMPLDEAAPRIYGLVNSIIADMMHKATVQRGLDPRCYTLVSIGGTAGMHVTSYASMVGIEKVIVPHSASVQSALGLISSNVVYEVQTTRPVRLPISSAELDGLFSPLVDRVGGLLENAGFEADRTSTSGMIDMRYSRQTHSVTVPIGRLSGFDESFVENTVHRFERLYQERFGQGSGYRDAGIEMVAFRVRGAGLIDRPQRRVRPLGDTDPGPALMERRRAWVPDRRIFEEVPGYTFDSLQPGNVIAGPAIVWSPSTTVVLRAADAARMDENTNLVIDMR